MTIPGIPDTVLQTIRLRPLREGDAIRLHEVLADGAVLHAFEQVVAPTLEGIQEDLPNMIAGKTTHDGQMHHLSAAIADAETDELIGLIGLDIIADGADMRIALHEEAHPEQIVGALLVVAGLVVTRLGSRTGPAPIPEPAAETASEAPSQTPAQTAVR